MKQFLLFLYTRGKGAILCVFSVFFSLCNSDFFAAEKNDAVKQINGKYHYMDDPYKHINNGDFLSGPKTRQHNLIDHFLLNKMLQNVILINLSVVLKVPHMAQEILNGSHFHSLAINLYISFVIYQFTI